MKQPFFMLIPFFISDGVFIYTKRSYSTQIHLKSIWSCFIGFPSEIESDFEISGHAMILKCGVGVGIGDAINIDLRQEQKRHMQVEISPLFVSSAI